MTSLLCLLATVRQDSFAVPLTSVQEVLELRTTGPPTPLPRSPAAVLGVLNVRGRVVCVVDTAAVLDLAALAAPERVALAVVHLARGLAALVLPELPRTAVLGAELGPSPLPTAVGRHRAADRVVTLLDLEATLAPDRIGR